jgi:hypothetical protein
MESSRVAAINSLLEELGQLAPGELEKGSFDRVVRLLDCIDPARAAGGVRRPLRPFEAAVVAEIYLCNVCSRQEILRRNGRG